MNIDHSYENTGRLAVLLHSDLSRFVSVRKGQQTLVLVSVMIYYSPPEPLHVESNSTIARSSRSGHAQLVLFCRNLLAAKKSRQRRKNQSATSALL